MTERRAGIISVQTWWLWFDFSPLALSSKNVTANRSALYLAKYGTRQNGAGKHHYADPEGRYLFVSAERLGTLGSYNTTSSIRRNLSPIGICSTPNGRENRRYGSQNGRGPPWIAFLYYNPDLGPQYLRRLLGQMDLTFSRDYRQARTGWTKEVCDILFSQSTTHECETTRIACSSAGYHRLEEGVGLDPVAAPTR